MITNMGRALNVIVLAVLLSFASAAEKEEDYVWNAEVVEEQHNYNYDEALRKMVPINADSLTKFSFDERSADGEMIRLVNEQLKQDGNCGGNFGVRHSFPFASNEVYCLKTVAVLMSQYAAGKPVPKTVTLSLFLQKKSGSQLELDVPLFKESSDLKEQEKYNSKVLRAEPITSDQISVIQAGSKTIDFSAPWMKDILDKPVNRRPRTYADFAFSTLPVVMPEDKFKELLKFIQSYQDA